MTQKVWIPQVPRERIEELAMRIKPVIRFTRGWSFGEGQSKRGDLYYIKPVDLFGIAYTWSPKRGKKAKGLVPLCEITTYHRWGHYVLFKPSIAEVLAQIPKEHLDAVVAFEVGEIAPFEDDREAFNAMLHVATTQLYKQSD